VVVFLYIIMNLAVNLLLINFTIYAIVAYTSIDRRIIITAILIEHSSSTFSILADVVTPLITMYIQLYIY